MPKRSTKKGVDERVRGSSSGEETRNALMDAALEALTERGVLAGLNLREVADAVGVTPANIYHLFGSRQGLLRAALQRETSGLVEDVDAARKLSFVDRRLQMFDVIAAHPRLALTALLAIDQDPEYQPLPFLLETRADYDQRLAEGDIPLGIDIEAVHLLSLTVAIGMAVYGQSAARQVGVDVGELHDRMRSVFEAALRVMISDFRAG
jgi:AcrR family transcriptional regulator